MEKTRVILVEVQAAGRQEPDRFGPRDFGHLLHRVRSGWRPLTMLLRYSDNSHHGRVVVPESIPEFPTWLARELEPPDPPEET
ncbi:MAG: hypothetical protein ACO4AU_10435 [bacterium]|jgi:hypothetical protein